MSEEITYDRRRLLGTGELSCGQHGQCASSGAPQAQTGSPTAHHRMVHQMTPAAVQLPIEGELPFARQRDRMAQFAAIDGGRPARKSRPHRLLDLYLHQLAPLTALCPRVGREIQGARIGGDRRAHA